MERLSNATLQAVPEHIARPGYTRHDMPTRIVHLGPGAFHRAHQAVYADDLMQAGEEKWGILGVSLHNPTITQALGPQDGLYTLLVQDKEEPTARIIGSLTGTAYLQDDRQFVLDALISPLTQIVTLTITRNGYGYDAAQDGLDLNNPQTQLDLNSPQNARSAIGLLAWAIFQRKQLGIAPFTLLSCDNMPANGKVLQRVLEDYIDRVRRDLGDSSLLQHFLDRYACPCSLVDRNTPAMRAVDIARTESLLGLHDAAPVITEPFRQWVIQDWFSTDRPAWEKVGVILTPHVAPYEQMHQRLLGGAQFALAWLGATAGHKTRHQAMQAPEMAPFIEGLMDDAGATLPRLPKPGWQDYKARLLQRFNSSTVEQDISQLAMDATLVLPGAMLEPMQHRLAHGLNIDRHALAIAAWIRCLTGLSERHQELFVADPLRSTLMEAVEKVGGYRASPHDLVDAVLAIPEVFGTVLPADMEFARAITAALQNLHEYRSTAAMAAINTPDQIP